MKSRDLNGKCVYWNNDVVNYLLDLFDERSLGCFLESEIKVVVLIYVKCNSGSDKYGCKMVSLCVLSL